MEYNTIVYPRWQLAQQFGDGLISEFIYIHRMHTSPQEWISISANGINIVVRQCLVLLLGNVDMNKSKHIFLNQPTPQINAANIITNYQLILPVIRQIVQL